MRLFCHQKLRCLNNQSLAISLAVISFFIAFAINELNLYHLKLDGIQLREGQTVVTNDDIGYLKPFKTYYAHGSLYLSDIQKYSSVVRSPGYGIIYYVSLRISGSENALGIQKLIQLILFSISVYCLFFISLYITNNKWPAIIVSILYGIIPIGMGFLYYTLTEAISPAFVIIYVFFLFKAYYHKRRKYKVFYYFIASVLLSYLILIRPFAGIFGIALPFFILKDHSLNANMFKSILHLLFFGMVSLSMIFIWQLRSYHLLGHRISLHPIYQNELPGVFRKNHLAIWNFYKGWESNGAHFHQTILPFWNASINGDTSHLITNKIVDKLPCHVKNFFGDKRLIEGFTSYQKSIYAQKEYYDKQLLMPSELLPEEKQTIEIFKQFENEYKKDFFLNYHFVTPINVLKNMIFHSNLSMYIFQKTFRNQWWMESLRYMAFFIHIFAFLSILVQVFWERNFLQKMIFGIIPFLYVCYLAYFQRGIEERYTLPLLPIILSGLVLSLNKFIIFLKAKDIKRNTL